MVFDEELFVILSQSMTHVDLSMAIMRKLTSMNFMFWAILHEK